MKQTLGYRMKVVYCGLSESICDRTCQTDMSNYEHDHIRKQKYRYLIKTVKNSYHVILTQNITIQLLPLYTST